MLCCADYCPKYLHHSVCNNMSVYNCICYPSHNFVISLYAIGGLEGSLQELLPCLRICR